MNSPAHDHTGGQWPGPDSGPAWPACGVVLSVPAMLPAPEQRPSGPAGLGQGGGARGGRVMSVLGPVLTEHVIFAHHGFS